MKTYESKSEKKLSLLLLGIPPFLLLLTICVVLIFWEDHDPSMKKQEHDFEEMEIYPTDNGLMPKRREDVFIEKMTLEEKVAQLFLLTPEGLTKVAQVSAAGETTREAFFEYPVGGIIYFGENLHTKEQTEALLYDMQQISMERLGIPVFLCLGESSEAALGQKFHLDFADTGMENETGLNFVRYFEGYGDEEDSSLISIRTEIEEGTNLLLMEHVAVSEGIPASLSEEIVTGVVREALGYEGVVITDAMNRNEILENYTQAESAVMALLAGADMILMPENFQEAFEGILEAVADGTITEERLNESMKRILKLKSKISG